MLMVVDDAERGPTPLMLTQSLCAVYNGRGKKNHDIGEVTKVQ